MPNTIVATPQARTALARIKAAHGDVMFHVAGGCCDAHSPICLAAGELRIGARDILLGAFDGVNFYRMNKSHVACLIDATFLLDVTPGTSVGFSIEAAPGMRFTLTEKTAEVVSWRNSSSDQPSKRAPA